ncbi:MAG: hypothetical protein FJ026_17910 [Chloroflexi bacterium]|nr:hypothetical protein [Chloroflexota bacterium]
MRDVPYKPEEQALKRIEEQQQAERQRQLERRIAEAQLASGGAAFKPEQASENEKLKLTVSDQRFERNVEAEHRLELASSPGDIRVGKEFKPSFEQGNMHDTTYGQEVHKEYAERRARKGWTTEDFIRDDTGRPVRLGSEAARLDALENRDGQPVIHELKPLHEGERPYSLIGKHHGQVERYQDTYYEQHGVKPPVEIDYYVKKS